MKRKKTCPPPLPLSLILASGWNVGSLSFGAIFFFFASPDGKSSLAGRLAPSTHRFKLLECGAGFLGVGVTPGVRFTLLFSLSRILTRNLHLRPFMLGSFPQRHGCIFPPNRLTTFTLLPVLDVCLPPFQLFFPNFNWKLSSPVSFGEDCGERGE